MGFGGIQEIDSDVGATIGGIFGMSSLGHEIGSYTGGLIDSAFGWDKNKERVSGQDLASMALKNRLERYQKALQTGMAYQPQSQAIAQAGATAMENIKSMMGGNVGATISAFSRVNRGTGRNLNELYGQMSNEGLRMNELIEKITNGLYLKEQGVNRYYEQQQWATDAAATNDRNANMNVGITELANKAQDWWKNRQAKKPDGTTPYTTPASITDNSAATFDRGTNPFTGGAYEGAKTDWSKYNGAPLKQDSLMGTGLNDVGGNIFNVTE